jgi:small-conductance mechanosensitive channel
MADTESTAVDGTANAPASEDAQVPDTLDAFQQAQEELRALEAPVLWFKDWFFGKVLVWESALQIGVVAAAFLLGLLLARPLRVLVTKAVEAKVRDRTLVGLIATGAELLLPVIWALALWIAYYVAVALAFPSALLHIVGSLLNVWIVIRIISSAVRNQAWARFFATVAWSIAALSILQLLEPAVRLLDSLAITLGETRISIFLVLKGALLALVLLWIATTMVRLLQRRIERSKSLTPSVRLLITQISRFTLILVAILIAVQSVGIDLTAFTVFSGALGVGIGFGLQKIVSNIISGIILLTDRSIKPGDVIEIGEAYGVVSSLGARYASVVTRDGVEYLIPNEDLIANTVINWSFSNRRVRRRLPIGVSYSCDVDQAMKLCIEAALETRRVLKDPPPNCLLVGFGDSSVDLELRFWIDDPEDGVANVSSLVLLAVWHKFKENGIEIPFPQRDVHLRPADGLAGTALAPAGDGSADPSA